MINMTPNCTCVTASSTIQLVQSQILQYLSYPESWEHTRRVRHSQAVSGLNQRGEIPWPDGTPERRVERKRARASNSHRKPFFSALPYCTVKSSPSAKPPTNLYQLRVNKPQSCSSSKRVDNFDFSVVSLREGDSPQRRQRSQGKSMQACSAHTHSPEDTGKGWQAGIKVKERGRVWREEQKQLEIQVEGGGQVGRERQSYQNNITLQQVEGADFSMTTEETRVS